MSDYDDHDQRFKTLLEEFLPEFIDLFFPDWTSRFDFGGTEWITEQAFLDPPAGERRLLDLVAKVPVTVSAAGTPGECLLLLHIEVESDESTTRLRDRMLQYYAFLRRKYGLPVLPIGLFLYVGHDGIGREIYQETVWGHTLLRFEFFRIGLPALEGTKYLAGSNVLGTALAALMKLPAADRLRFFQDGLARIDDSGENEMRRYFLAECYENYFPLSEADRAKWHRAAEERRLKGGQLVGGLELREQRGIRIGEQRGEQRGIQIGEERGRIQLLLKLLTKKFGPLPDEVQTKLTGLPAERLDEIALEVNEAASLTDLGLSDS